MRLFRGSAGGVEEEWGVEKGGLKQSATDLGASASLIHSLVLCDVRVELVKRGCFAYPNRNMSAQPWRNSVLFRCPYSLILK